MDDQVLLSGRRRCLSDLERYAAGSPDTSRKANGAAT
jgi:hypothetical protein